MVDLAATNKLKTTLNVNAPPFIPSSVSSNFNSGIRHQNHEESQRGNQVEDGRKIMSYSAALKSVPKPKAPVAILIRNEDMSNESNRDQSSLGENEQKTSDNKDSGAPVALKSMTAKRKNKPSKMVPLADFIALQLTPDTTKTPKATSKPKDPAKSTLAAPTNGSGNKARPSAPKEAHKEEKHSPAVPRGNILDSTAPVLHKGKQRENPKKKFTRMKKMVLNERRQYHQPGGPEEETDNGNGTAAVEQSQVEPDLGNDNEMTAGSLGSSGYVSMSVIAGPVPIASSKPRPKGVAKYCDNVLSRDLDEHVKAVIHELGRFQDRLHAVDPNKARMKKRLVYGLREVHKLLKVEKIKCVIFAPNIEPASGEGGLDEIVSDILKMCREQNVTYLFALTKMKLGFIFHKHTPVSCAGILNYQGADVQFKAMLEFVSKAKQDFVNASQTADNDEGNDSTIPDA